MSSVIVVDKKSLDQSTVSGSRIVLETASKVHTQLYRSDVAEFVQDGNDLILKLKNGKTIVIVNFFVAHEDETSDVLFKDDNGIPWLPLLLGGAGVAGGLALASGGGGDNNGGAASTSKNHVPVAGLSNQPIETKEDTEHQGKIIAEDKDKGDELSYKVGEEPKNGKVIIDEKTGEYTYTPNLDYHGDDKFTVVVSDGNGGEVAVTVPVTVTPVNDAPTAEAEQGFTTDEDTEHKSQIVAKDKDGDELTYKVGEEPKSGQVVIDEKTGKYTYTPNSDYHGDDKFTVVVSDGKGGEVTVTVPITVTPVNDAPTAEAEQGFTTDEDKHYTGKIEADDPDISTNGDKLTYEVDLTDGPQNGTVQLDKETGKYTYTPNDHFNGNDHFTVIVKDKAGESVKVKVPVTVTPVNDAPTAEAEQGFTTDEDKHYTGKIEADDPDISMNGDKLTYEVDPTDEPQKGTVQLDKETGKYTYTPNDHFNGNDHFTVIVKDKAGESVKVKVPVIVNPGNDAPDLDDAEVTVKQGVKGLEVHDVNDASTGKDEDVDGDKLTYAITGGNEDGLFDIDPDTGIITLADGKMLDHGKASQHQLEVTATDNSSDQLSSTATITINVSNDSKITTEITPKGEITGTTDNVEKGPVKLTITGTDKNGQPVTIERTVELDRQDGSSKGKYTYQLTPKDGIVDGSKVTVEAKTIDRQGDTIHADTELPGYSDEDKTPGLDIVEPTIEITTSAGGHKVIWSEGSEGDLSNSSKQGFTIDGTTTGVEAGQKVTVTLDQTADGKPITVEAIVDEEGKWSAEITPDIAAILKDGSATVTVSDRAGNSTKPKTIDYTVDAPSANVTGYYDNIENVLNTVVAEGKVSETVTISSEIDPNLASDTTKKMVGEKITGDHGTFTLDASGKWTYTLNSGEATSKALIDSKGPLTEIFTVKDSEGKSYEVKVSINDRVADDGENVVVSATTSSLLKDPAQVESDQGAYTIYTNDSLGKITGTASQGVEKVRVYVNKQAAGTDAEMDSLGYPQYFEVEGAVKDGKWSLSEQDLTNGLQKTWWADQLRNDNIYLQVRAVDPTTGKVGDVSEKYTFVVDTVAPEATYVNYADGKVTALVSGDPADAHRAATGNDVIVKYTDTDGNVQVVTGKVGDKAVADKPYLSISVDVKDLDPTKEFKVYVKDNAGNIGVNNDSKENPLKIELPTPQVDQYHDNVNNVSGTEIIGNTGYSDDPSGLISGTIVLTEADLKVVDSVRVYLYDNRQNWIEIDKNDLVKESGDTYRWTTKPGDLSKVTTTGKLAEGEVKFYAATYDKESGSLSELSPPFKVTIDVTAPEITIESVAGDQVITQLEKKDGFTVKGATKGAEEGNTVTILVEGKSYTTTVGKDGKWSIDLPKEATQDLTDGKTYTITASVTDKAGNQSSEANSEAIVNAAPIVTTQTQTVEEDSGTSRYFQVKATDPEDNRINGYSLKYEVLEDTLDPSKGSVVMDEYDDGHFIFTPEKNFSGEVTFSVKVTDSYGNSTIAEQKIIVTPVADAPVLKTEMNFDVGELSLNKYTWNNIAGYKQIGDQWYDFRAVQTTGSGINPTELVNGINALFEHQRPEGELTNEMKSEGWSESEHGWGLPESGAVYMNGYVYLEAGKDYKYTGSADDNGLIIIGDNESSKYVSWEGLPSTTTETFNVKTSGFYTFNLYIYNESEKGNYNFKVTEADGKNVKYFPSVEAIKGELGKDVHLAKEMTGKGDKGFYGVSFGYTGSENDDVELTGIVASLADRDGSETLSLKLTGLVEGTKLIYTSVDKDGREVTSEAVADSHGSITVNGGANVTDFKDLSLDLPQGIATGKLPVAMTVTATEQGNGDAKSVTNEFTVTVNPPVAARMMVTDESEEDHTSDAHVIKIGLLEDNNTGGHSLEKVINFAINQSEESSESSKIEFSEDFFSGLISTGLTADNLVNVEKFINVTYDKDTQTATISVDRDGVGDDYKPEELLLLTNQPTEISLADLLDNHQIVIG